MVIDRLQPEDEPESIGDVVKHAIPAEIPSWVTPDPGRHTKLDFGQILLIDEAEEHERRRERLNIPRSFTNATIDDFRDQDFLGGLRIDPPAFGDILICGKNGRGKSHLAAAIAFIWGARWCSAARFLVEIRSTFGRSNSSEYDLIRSYAERPSLVLDDLTSGSGTGHSRGTILALLDWRVSEERPTIVTLYQSRTQIEAWDPSIASRLKAFDTIELIGADRREAR